MNYIMVVNKSGFPLHGALSWAGIQQACFNDLNRDQSHDFVVELGWTDLTIIAGSWNNRFTSDRNQNIFKTAGLFLLKAYLVMSPGSQLYNIRLLGTEGSKICTFQLGVEPSGEGSGRKNVKIEGGDFSLDPIKVTDLYCPDGYTVTVTGGEVTGDYDEGSNTFTIKNVTPLKLSWTNRKSGSQGTKTASG